MSLFKKLLDKISGKEEKNRYDNFPLVSEPLNIRKNTTYSSNSSSNSNQTNHNDMRYEVRYVNGHYEATIDAYEKSTPVQYQPSVTNNSSTQRNSTTLNSTQRNLTPTSSNSSQAKQNDIPYKVKYVDGYYEAKIEAYEQSTPVQYPSSAANNSSTQGNLATDKTYAEVLAEWKQKRDQEQQAKRAAEEKARLVAEENAKRIAEENARRLAEENARRIAAEKAAQAVRDAEYIKKGDKCFLDAECMMFAILGYDMHALEKLEKYIEAKNWYLKASCDCSAKIAECDKMIEKKTASTFNSFRTELKFAQTAYSSKDYDSATNWITSVENGVYRLKKLNINFNHEDVLKYCKNLRQAIYEQMDYDKKVAECEKSYEKAKEKFNNYQIFLNSHTSINDYSSCLNGLDEIYSLINEASDYVDTSELFNAVNDAEEEWQNKIDELKND